MAQPSARTVTGTVTDRKPGKAVSSVTVKAPNAAASLLSYAMTGADGASPGRPGAVRLPLRSPSWATRRSASA